MFSITKIIIYGNRFDSNSDKCPTLDEMVYSLFMKNTCRIEDYFTDKEIIKILCNKRALASKKVHDSHFLRNITSGVRHPNPKTKEIYNYFPPRKDWIRLNLDERNTRNTNALELNRIQLERTVWRFKLKYQNKPEQSPEWLTLLNKFLIEIRYSVFFDENIRLNTPKVILVVKNKEKNEYRPISSFLLKDLIIIGQVSKYLTNCFDPLFLNCSYAFRSAENSQNRFSHHKAVKDIIDFRKGHGNNIFVAECDIKNFMTVSIIK